MNSSLAALSPPCTRGNNSRIRSLVSTGRVDVSTPQISTLLVAIRFILRHKQYGTAKQELCRGVQKVICTHPYTGGECMERMQYIRRATHRDLERLAEIRVFNYRLNFYPIFRDDEYYFDTMRVSREAEVLKDHLRKTYVYDDGAVKGYVLVYEQEIVHLFVEPVLQGQGIGEALLWFAVEVMGCNWLWALEKNERAISFYQRNLEGEL